MLSWLALLKIRKPSMNRSFELCKPQTWIAMKLLTEATLSNIMEGEFMRAEKRREHGAFFLSLE